MWVTSILIGGVVFLLAKWYRERRALMNTFKRLGIPGPEPHLLHGNMKQYQKEGWHKCLTQWQQQYGDTYGYFEPSRPILVTSDPDILKTILIKEFSNFAMRKTFALQEADVYPNMFSAEIPRWKKLRTISSQLFVPRKMKEMSPMINHTIDRVVDILDEKCQLGEAFDIGQVLQGMTLEVIGSCAFGMDVDALHNRDDPFFVHCRQVFEAHSGKRSLGTTIIMMLAMYAPDMLKYVKPLLRSGGATTPLQWFHDIAKVMIEKRQNDPEKVERVDFIQLMLDTEDSASPVKLTDLIAHTDDDTSKAQSDMTVKETQSDQKQHQSPPDGRKLSMKEMQGQCRLFLLAGFETTATGLSFLSYELAMNPDVQEKLRAEVDEYFPEDSKQPDYMSVQKLPYMDMVMKELLRLHTIAALAMTRRAEKDSVINGVKIPAGMIIQVNPEAMHMKQEHWGPEDVHKFVPERFLPDRVKARHPLVWLPFGGGPRNCVGMRFAQLEIKITLVRILKRYEFVRTEKTPDQLPVAQSAIQRPSEGVYIKLVRRE